VEVETAERARVQSAWILTGALDWARLLLREDSYGKGATQVDHLGEPWAVPLQEARLSSFLAADKNNTSTDYGPEMMDAFLSGQIIDLQSMMNLNNLIVGAKVDPHRLEAFARLFEILGLPQSELTKLHENLRFAIAAGLVTPSPPQAPLQPKRVSELVWLGLKPSTISALEPYVTIIARTDTPLNLNTASPEAIAAVCGINLADAQRMVQIRSAGNYFRSWEDFESHLSGPVPYNPAEDYLRDVKSEFFEVHARLRLDKLVVEERSVLERIGVDRVRVVSRERGAGDPTALSRLTVTQR
jgi:general secretion pathway protein K